MRSGRRHLRGRLLHLYGRLPARARVAIMRSVTPTFRVGAVCVVQRDDGAVLLVRHSYRRGWGLPGGLLKRGEPPATAAAREAREELGVALDLAPEARVVVDARHRRVDVLYRARLPAGPADAGGTVDGGVEGAGVGGGPPPRPTSPEILEVGWFPPDDLPSLGREAVSALAELGITG
ncbi:MAG: NUDIX domain-containing protein [Acidimicrobiales bacterium]